MVHHADLDYDLTTCLRFHPAEIVFSMILKLTIIVALGPSVASVLTFEILLNSLSSDDSFTYAMYTTSL
jgi:sterol desaturase/sphingolipid hydroxylase (fatty acid hydroxylase superfamily)